MTAALKSLTFTTLPKQGANPIFDRRAKVIASPVKYFQSVEREG